MLYADGVLSDVTDRKLAEGKLEESINRFNDIADSALEWIWEVDAEGFFTYASPVIERTLGYKPEELIGKKHFLVISMKHLGLDTLPKKDFQTCNLSKI